MRVCIVGGKLQGLEAVYLSKKAGFETILIDRDPHAPAAAVADEFHCQDIIREKGIESLIKSADCVLPCNENRETLIFLERLSKRVGIPYMQDNEAFWVSSNKNKARELFNSLSVPQPQQWPESGYPVIVKPATGSGSVGVHRADNEEQLKQAIKKSSSLDDELIIQKFIEGQALSLELIGLGKDPLPLQIIQLEFEENYGCKRVFAPDLATEEERKKFVDISVRIAKSLNLNGLMDSQAIVDDKGVPLMIEINARLPSQTPTVVYHSSGINMVELLAKAFIKGKMPNINIKPRSAVIYQHIQIADGKISTRGEHIMSCAQNLRIEKDFFGIDEVITNIEAGNATGVATLIAKDSSLERAKRKLSQAIRGLLEEFQLREFFESTPGDMNDKTHI
jgi:pyrrolysine biosynthesis protein PylC